MKALGRGSIAAWIKIALDVGWVLLWIGACALGAFAALYALTVALANLGVIPAGLLPTVIDGEPVDLASVSTLIVTIPGLLAAGAAIAGGLVIVDRLKKLFASFCSNEPFLRENAQHLRIIWIAMLAMELSRYAIAALVGLFVAAFGQPHGGRFDFTFSVHISAWLSIGVLIVLAEVFREGARMREEQELTI
jgi:hypothetical protein